MSARGKSSSPTPPSGRRRRTSIIRSTRYEPTLAYVLAEHLKQNGTRLHEVHGPWRPLRRSLQRRGRNEERNIPIVTNGVTEIAVDSVEHAADLSGFLNWCGVTHLDPIANLRPPEQDLLD